MKRIYTAPEELPIVRKNFRPRTVFLAGSIEMGKAEHWQKRAMEHIIAETEDTIIFNPRRADWDSSWVQSIDNEQFYAQVNWELDALDRSDFILMYLQPGTQSPISLLEFGLHAPCGNMIVCCPEGFWRKGNVDIVCERHNIEQVSTLDELIAFVPKYLKENYG